MGYLAVILILIPLMSFVWLLVENYRKAKRITRLEANLEVTGNRYAALKDFVIRSANKEPLEGITDVREMAKNLADNR